MIEINYKSAINSNNSYVRLREDLDKIKFHQVSLALLTFIDSS